MAQLRGSQDILHAANSSHARVGPGTRMSDSFHPAHFTPLYLEPLYGVRRTDEGWSIQPAWCDSDSAPSMDTACPRGPSGHRGAQQLASDCSRITRLARRTTSYWSTGGRVQGPVCTTAPSASLSGSGIRMRGLGGGGLDFREEIFSVNSSLYIVELPRVRQTM